MDGGVTYSVEVDAHDLHGLTEQAHTAFDRMGGNVLAIIESGARELRETDPYQDHPNRRGTEELRKNTKAVEINISGDGWLLALVMDTSYASHVNNRGFTSVDIVGGEELPRRIQAFLDGPMLQLG